MPCLQRRGPEGVLAFILVELVKSSRIRLQRASTVRWEAFRGSVFRPDAGRSTWLSGSVPLIARQAPHRGDPLPWPGSRRSNVQDFTFNPQSITWSGRIWPNKFSANPDDTAGDRQTALDQKAHGDRGSVPTACRQARKQGVLGSLVIKVEGLRIELTGKCFDLLLINDVGCACEALPDVKDRRDRADRRC